MTEHTGHTLRNVRKKPFRLKRVRTEKNEIKQCAPRVQLLCFYKLPADLSWANGSVKTSLARSRS